MDETDDARSLRGFGRSTYDSGLVDRPEIPGADNLANIGTVDEQLAEMREEKPEQDPDAPGFLEGNAVGRAIKRGGLRAASSLPTGMGISDATALADSALTDPQIIADTVKQATGLDQLPRGIDLSTPERAAQAIIEMGFSADRPGIFRQIYEERSRRAGDARANPDKYRQRAELNFSTGSDLIGRANALPMSQTAERMRTALAKDTTVGGTIAAMLDDPAAAAAFLGEIGIESVPAIAGSAAAGLATRSPGIGAAVMGGGAVAQEFGASVNEFLREQGVKIETREDAIAVLNSPDLMRAAGERGMTRGVVIAAFEAMGQGVAAKKLLHSKVGNALMQTAVQASAGAGGEAVARAAAGQEMSGQDILIEGLAEMVTAPVEVGAAALSKDGAEADADRINSPRLTETDRASPLPNATIDDGKAIIDDLLSGKAPALPAAPAETAAPEVPASAAVASKRPEAPAVALGQPERDAAPQQTAQPVQPSVQSEAPEMPGANADTEILPVMDENGRETGEFVQWDAATGRMQKVSPDTPPQIDTTPAAPTQAVQEEIAPREEPATRQDLDQPQAADAAPDAPTGAPAETGAFQDLIPQKPKVPSKTSLHKRPVANELKSRGLSVKPGSPLAQELKSRGITARSHPGLFNRDGVSDLDNLPAQEWGDYRHQIGEDGNGYLNRQGIIDALETEMRGAPVRAGVQADLAEEQSARNAAEAEARFEAADPDPHEIDLSHIPDASIVIAHPEEDISTPIERMDHVKRNVDTMLRETGIADAVPTKMRQDIITVLNQRGGNVEDAVWWNLHRKADGHAEQTAEPDLADRPADRQTERSGDVAQEIPGDIGRSEGEPGTQKGSPAVDSDDRRVDGRQAQVTAAAEVNEAAAEARRVEPAPLPSIPADLPRQAAKTFPSIKEAAPLPFGPSSIRPRSIAEGKSLYRETSPDALDDILRVDGQPDAMRTFVTDNRDLAIGQGGNKGVMLTFRSDSLSGEVHQKPGTTAKTGQEYRTDMRVAQALAKVEIPKAMLKQVRGLSARVLKRDFDRTEAGETVVFTRKGYQDPEPAPAKPSPKETPSTERTEAGEQAVIPGAEQSDERSAEAREADQRRELEARQQQSKKGTTVPQDDAGPLFDTQGNMLDTQKARQPDADAANAPEPAPKPSKTQKRLADILREEWTVREDLPEDANDEFIVATKRVQDARRALADEFGEDTAKSALEEIEAGYKPKPTAEPVQERTDQEPVKKERIEDFGEKIGGARKDIADKTGPRGKKAKAGSAPAWRKRYEVSEIVADTGDKSKVGKWVITEKKTGRQIRDGYRVKGFDSEAEAETAIPLYEVARNHRVRSRGDGFSIDRVTGKRSHTFKDGFKTREEAMEYMAKNAVEIIETDMRLDDRIHPALEEALRAGEERRAGGRDVTPQDFSEVFGFRGVEFGKWNNAAERQHILNQAFDSFLDLSEILGVPPKAISLNGDLALAFGARGHGLTGGRAHYERNYGVINLTKIQGAGALAHEWMHAADHFFGRQDGKASSEKITNDRGDKVFDAKDQGKDYASHGFQYRKSGVREEVREAYKAVMQAIAKRKSEFKEDVSTRERIESRTAEQLEQKLKSFRDYLAREEQYARKQAPATKAQLLKIDKLIKQIQDGKLGEKEVAPTKSRSSFPPMFNEPVMKLAEIYKEVRGRQAYRKHQGRDTGPAVDLQHAIEAKLRADQFLADAKKQKVKEKTVTTEFVSEAWKLDQGRASAYWATNHELIARAFEGYVYDRLKDIDARNDFLAYEKHNLLPEYMLFNVKPYPEGKERTDINAAFRSLFDTIQTEETDKGVRMYQRQDPVLVLEGDEISGSDIRELRKSAQAWFKGNLLNTTATTRDGWEVRFNNTGLRKVTSKGDEILRYVPAIREIVEQGEIVETRPGNRAGINAVHVLSAPVELAGEVRNVIVSIREMSDGRFHYDLSLSRDQGGKARPSQAEGGPMHASPSPVSNQPSLEINLGFETEKFNRRANPAKLQDLLPDLKARLNKLMIRGVDLSIDPDMREQGAVEFGPEGIEILIGNTLDGMNTVNHEAIHILRQRGLFSDAEWNALAAEAESRWMAEFDIEARYPDLSQEAHIEEAIAEAFAAHADGRAAKGRLKTIFAKIRRFFRAMKEALAGQGIRKPEDIFEAVERGEVGSRDGRVTGEELLAVKHQRPSAAVRTLKPAGVQATAVSTHSASIPDDTRFERFRRLVQDRMLVLRRMSEATEKQTGQHIRKEEDPYFAEERYSGRVGYLLDEIEDNYTKPIIALIAERPIKIADHKGKVREGAEAVSLWLMARHAKERNAHIASINDQMPDGGSGLTNAEANAILQQAGANRSRLDQIGALTDRLGKEMITAREAAGLLSAQEAHMWRTMYKHYVPLQKFAEDDMFDGVVNDARTAMGRKFSVKGKEGQSALGRSTEAFDPLATLLTQAMEVTVRTEKNQVAKVMYNFAVRHPNPAMYEITQPESQRFYNKATGKVETRVVGPASRQLAENEMALKVDGKEYRITFKDPRLAEALGQLGSNEMGKVTAVASLFSRYFSTINTMLSPPFVIVNALRDMMTAQVNLGAFGGDIQGKLRKSAMRDWVKAMRGSHRGLRGKTDTEYAKWFKEYSEAGGRIHFWKVDNPESQSLDFGKRVKRASRGKLTGTVSRLALPSTRDNPALSVIETVNMSVDNAVRLATYAEARRNGWSKADAASLAKNLTVNFNRRGEIGATMNAWYPFANAAIQGSHVILKAMRSKQVQGIVGGMVLFGFANDLLAAMLSGEDEDGELEYDQLPSYVSERNIIVATPLTETGYVTIPLPYGYNVFFFAGQQMGKMIRGVKSPDEAAGQLLKATVGAFSPISGESGFEMLAPTVLDFANEFDNNRDWLGRPIRPENPYGDYGPQSYKEFNASAPSRTVAQGLNTLTGGSPLEPGLIDVSPEYIDHFFKFMTGGAGRFAGRVYGLGERAAEGTLGDVEAYEVPLARVLYTEAGDFLNQNRYFEFREAVQEARKQRKLSEEIGYPMTQEMKDLNALWVTLRQTEKQRKVVSGQINAIYSNESLNARERERRMKPLKDRRNEIYLRFNRSYIDRMGPQAE
ncbi:LPD38 domain-containing protein [Leisingera sp. M523]|uniref:LPD38 domain-containing protein n=1 Tax=Leisingera sp. M523 TaxID=2867013 RepID=UPI0021A9555A|nr:LPD38 domain-containing protein [Leisingera sp. M523]UWQ30271.1 hypothetical protein K3557_06960 [Leisingera sp. M523]